LDNPLLMAFGLMLVLEGALPFMAPRVWRQTFQRMIDLNDGQLRFVGLAFMAVGVLLMFVLR
jgi:uncharacterized protein YjeT (DUF2065 family)